MDRVCAKCGKHFEGFSIDINCPECRKKREYPLRDKVCEQCGAPYQTRGTTSRFCPQCANDRRIESIRKSKNGKRRKIGSIDICEECGNEYIVDGGMQRYCPDCQKSMEAERRKAYYNSAGKERRKERIANRAMATATCIVCGKEFPINGERSLCCSAECSSIYLKNYNAEYKKENRETFNAKARERYARSKQGEDARTLLKKTGKANTSGVVGVHYQKSTGVWVAEIYFKQKRYYLGSSTDKQKAIEMRKAAEQRTRGEFLDWYYAEHPSREKKDGKKD